MHGSVACNNGVTCNQIPTMPFISYTYVTSSILCNIPSSSVCSNASHILYTIFTDVTLNDTAEDSVRLVGGANLTDGCVEVFFLGQWGTVCNYGWDLVDATVVCHQLGYLRADRSTSLGAGSGPSWYSNVQCAGTEMKLTECRKSISRLGHACSSSQKAGVVCSSELACYYKHVDLKVHKFCVTSN